MPSPGQTQLNINVSGCGEEEGRGRKKGRNGRLARRMDARIKEKRNERERTGWLIFEGLVRERKGIE